MSVNGRKHRNSIRHLTSSTLLGAFCNERLTIVWMQMSQKAKHQAWISFTSHDALAGVADQTRTTWKSINSSEAPPTSRERSGGQCSPPVRSSQGQCPSSHGLPLCEERKAWQWKDERLHCSSGKASLRLTKSPRAKGICPRHPPNRPPNPWCAQPLAGSSHEQYVNGEIDSRAQQMQPYPATLFASRKPIRYV